METLDGYTVVWWILLCFSLILCVTVGYQVGVFIWVLGTVVILWQSDHYDWPSPRQEKCEKIAAIALIIICFANLLHWGTLAVIMMVVITGYRSYVRATE